MSNKTFNIENLTLMDDVFMNAVFDENYEAAELVLNVVLNRTDLKVRKIRVQNPIPAIKSKSVRFDIFAIDATGKAYDIEIQNRISDSTFKRARFYSSMLDTILLEKSDDFDNLVDTYVIFFIPKDVFGDGLPMYTIDRKVNENNVSFDDGSHIIFVNCSYDDTSTKIGKLIKDMKCKDPDNMYYPALANRARDLKETEGGINKMSEYMQKFYNDAKAEGKAECISIFMKETNCKIEDALKKFEIPEAEWDAYRKLIHD